MAEQMSGASSVGDARESDARDDTCRSKNLEGVLGSTERKPHLTVRFHNFVQTLTPEKVQAFEILRGHELNGMMQCAVQPMVHVDNCGRSVDRPLHGTVKELIPSFVKDASVRMGGPQVAEQGNSEDATGPCTYATKNAAECFGPRSGRRVIRLEEAVPAPRQISTCVIPDMVDYLTEGHSMSDLHVDCPMVHELPPKEKDVCLQSMCKQSGSDKFSCVHVFTDGAFDEEASRGAWAFACYGELEKEWHWLGFMSGPCDDKAGLRDGPCYDAYVPECAAILRALVTLLECECRICVHFDSTSAAHSIEGKSACNDIVAKAASGVLMVHGMQERHVAFVHEKSHSGIPQNELVDLLAKHALKGHAYGQKQDTVSTTVLDGS